MAYVYRHIRLDKNVPFYIGVGSDNKGYYKRAFQRNRKLLKNAHWDNVVNKTEYEVEIILDNITVKEALEKEKEFIKIYGRSDLGLGPLVNHTNGGDGVLGLRCEQKNKEKYRKLYSRKICQYDLNGIFIKVHDSAKMAAKEVNSDPSHLGHCANGTKSYRAPKGFIWRWFNGSDQNIVVDVVDKRANVSPLTIAATMKSVDQYTTDGIFVRSFESCGSAARSINVTRMCITDCLKGRQKTSGGYVWKYSKKDR